MSIKKPVAVVFALCMTSAAVAQTVTFESLDKNSDGQISIQEATANDDLFVAFKQLDTNKDGALSKEEFAAWKK